MSDLAAAAAKLGVAEGIVKRSAEARAKATGSSVDEVLAAWAGGAAAPVPTPSEPATSPESRVPSQTEETPDARRQTPDEPEPLPASPPSPSVTIPTGDRPPATGVLRPATGDSPPLLVGRRERMGLTLTGSIGLLVLSVLLGFFLPSLPQPSNGVRSSNHAYSRAALAGRELYLQEGCGTCHTQLIRSVVPDAHLGPVTLDDTNQVIGSRRIGPDLAAIGGRLETDALLALLTGQENHPTTSLSASELTELLAYLEESR